MKYIIINKHDDPTNAIGPFASMGTAHDWIASIFREKDLEIKSPSFGETSTNSSKDSLTMVMRKATPTDSGNRSERVAWYEILPIIHPNDS